MILTQLIVIHSRIILVEKNRSLFLNGMIESHWLLRSMISLPLVVCWRMMWLGKVKSCPPILVVDLF